MKRPYAGFALLSALLLSGCSHLPLDGPAYRDIEHNASAALQVDRRAVAYDYALVDLNSVVLDHLDHVGTGSMHTHFHVRSGGRSVSQISIGDVVQVSVFESAAGGLFVPAEAGPRAGNFVSVPNQVVSREGTISVPYAGAIRVAGRTPSQVERTIESRLKDRAIEPQVILTMVEQNGASVSIFGEPVTGGNRFKLSAGGERILDVISRAGGIRTAGFDVFVTLQRDGRRGTIHFPKLVSDPKENIFVAPGDMIYLYRDQQKFVAVGALGSSSQTSGLTGQFPFDQERLSLNEALAKAGGLQDSRANPSQIFLYRIEHRALLEKMGVDLSRFADEQKLIPTVYRSNFRDPSSFFSAQKFSMRNRDVIYVANSDATEMFKFLAYVRGITSTVSGVATDYAITRDVLYNRTSVGN